MKMKIKYLLAFAALATAPMLYAISEKSVDLSAARKNACSDNTEGDLCTFDNANGESISGQCKRGSDADTTLYCIPNSNLSS